MARSPEAAIGGSSFTLTTFSWIPGLGSEQAKGALLPASLQRSS
jgi:hypothetical protein